MRSNLLGKKYKCPIKKSKYKPNRGELTKKKKKNSLLLCIKLVHFIYLSIHSNVARIAYLHYNISSE